MAGHAPPPLAGFTPFRHQKGLTMSVTDTVPAQHSRLAHFPITFFATGMGMMGLTLALRAAETSFPDRRTPYRRRCLRCRS